jgi:microsomal dipeptidase-like Zn-dependent dipeptidase
VFDVKGKEIMKRNDTFLLMSSKQALRGWVDMHTHPMAHLSFSGKLIHGGTDVGSLLPTDSQGKKNIRARNIAQALCQDNCTHGGWGFDNQCGDYIRQQVIDNLQKECEAAITPDSARGAPDFEHWPKWNDITHQKMWVEWIERAYWSGLRVMIALAVHNQTLAAAVGGPGDGPMDDKGSADLQIKEIKTFVNRHSDFMELAYSPQDLRKIVKNYKIAVILGVEIDAFGNFHKGTNPTPNMIKDEILYLYDQGIRYIFPIHVIDNKLGGAAVYQSAFNISNYREYGDFFTLQCSSPVDNITYKHVNSSFDLAAAFVKVSKLGIDPFRNPPDPPSCNNGTGHMNEKGLTLLGESAIKEMMKLGMMIDIDHMSQKSANRALEIAKAIPDGGYPLNSGHNGPRRAKKPYNTEYQRTDSQLQDIEMLGGMLGLGTADIRASTFIENYYLVKNATENIGIGIGTDTNGMAKMPRPGTRDLRYGKNFPKSKTLAKEWDYKVDGVAHYGMFADFLRDVEMESDGKAVIAELWYSAEKFARMWERCEAQKTGFGANLPVISIDGIGDEYAAKLGENGIYTLSDLVQMDSFTHIDSIPQVRLREFRAKARMVMLLEVNLTPFHALADRSISNVLSERPEILAKDSATLTSEIIEQFQEELTVLDIVLDDAHLKEIMLGDMIRI